MRFLVLSTLLLTAADHWTTWLCLRKPVEGWVVGEANPIADWLFTTAGLVPGLLIDSVVTVLAVAFLISTRLLPESLKVAFLGMIVMTTSYAVVNNLDAMWSLGISPLGWS
ncbi:MAG: hypothetical protein MJE66_23230 [Proteobacteria bacterium]|nr:hypothetical protein [Pseudomonadota bacterium]